MPRIVVVGLGPAGPELLTVAAREAIAAVPDRFVRTSRHPAAGAVEGATSFDDVYESAATLDEVYARIVDNLVAEASRCGQVLYAVPGSPLVAERTVELLLARSHQGADNVGADNNDGDLLDIEVIPGLSFLDLAWARLRVDPVARGVRIVDGHRFAAEAAGDRGPVLVAQCDTRQVLSDMKLSVEGYPTPEGVVVLHHLGLPDEVVAPVAWDDLDRSVEPDHLTAVYVARLASPVGAELVRFAELVRTLRERCPWDREQTHESLTRHLLEETYEVMEAIRGLGGSVAGDGVDGAGSAGEDLAYAHLEEELGDLLFQVVFHSTLGAEAGRFTLADVARTVHDKLVGRHPHVFGDVEATTPGAVMRNWEQIKKVEKGVSSLMDGLPGDLPSLLYAHKVQRKAHSAGVDLALGELGDLADTARAERSVDAVGDLLFSAVALSRDLGVDPEFALHGAARRFRDRFVVMETLAAGRGVDLDTADEPTVSALWAAGRDGAGAALGVDGQPGPGRSPQS